MFPLDLMDNQFNEATGEAPSRIVPEGARGRRAVVWRDGTYVIVDDLRQANEYEQDADWLVTIPMDGGSND